MKLGIFISSYDTGMIEIICGLGIDCIIIDWEHKRINVQETEDLIRCCNLYKIECIIRINTTQDIQTVYDMGGDGILIAQSESVDQLKSYIGKTKFPPHGELSFHPGMRGNYRQQSDKKFSIRALIESKQSLDNLPGILSLNEIDHILIGPYDLSRSLGEQGDTTTAIVQNAIQSIKKLSDIKNKQVSIVSIDIHTIKGYETSGFNYCILGSDFILFKKMFGEFLTNIKSK